MWLTTPTGQHAKGCNRWVCCYLFIANIPAIMQTTLVSSLQAAHGMQQKGKDAIQHEMQ